MHVNEIVWHLSPSLPMSLKLNIFVSTLLLFFLFCEVFWVNRKSRKARSMWYTHIYAFIHFVLLSICLHCLRQLTLTFVSLVHSDGDFCQMASYDFSLLSLYFSFSFFPPLNRSCVKMSVISLQLIVLVAYRPWPKEWKSETFRDSLRQLIYGIFDMLIHYHIEIDTIMSNHLI